MTPSFVHLHVHSEYSLADSILRIKPMMQTVAQANMPAIALTDQSNMFALVKFYNAALAAGIKPVIGVDVLLREDKSGEAPSRIVLLCQNDVGYRNLTILISKGYTDGQYGGLPLIEKTWLAEYQEGLIALSGGRFGDVGRALVSNKQADAEKLVERWLGIFGDRYYIELQRTGREDEEVYNAAALSLASDKGIPVVATNDVRFTKQADFEAHEVRVCIYDGRTLDDPRRPRNYSDQQYLKSPEEMQALFSDIPEALTNTVEIAKRCNLTLHIGESFLPNFPVPEGQTTDSYFVEQARSGLEQRLAKLQNASDEVWSEEKVQSYWQRLDVEVDVITKMGFPGYFLIVADFIRWSKNNDIPVGPGRGSGAGSLVAYAMDITDLDPIEFDLLFERFLNPERVSLPDFDIDFCMEGRDRVIDYVANRYGREKVSQIITYGSMAAKAVVRDVGRVLGHPYGFVDRIAKLIPFEIGMTLGKALDDSEELRTAYQEEEEVTILLDMAQSLEGLARNVGKHAGGVVIAPSKLTDFTPLYCEQDRQGLVTQLDKDDVESIGLVKFDFLGLRTLTIIDWAVKAINKRRETAGEVLLDIADIPMDDSKTFDLLQAQVTTAVFQLESRGMKDLIKRLKPDTFDHIVALVALFRPGPLQSGMVDDFIKRRHGEKTNYDHPLLEPILQPTYGIILYQEQVMQIAQDMAGYTLGGADLLRRAMGKKKPEEMAKQREIFTNGSVENGIKESIATYIFDQMEKFAGYGFNKSHSAAYALLSYQTAWLKAHYPSEFMAAVLSSDMDNTDKVVTLIDECNAMSLKVVPPDVNNSSYSFTAKAKDEIVYGLGAIKGLGAAAIDSIEQEQNANGAFKDIYEFCRRIDGQKINKRSQEALIRSGALDSLGANRATLMARLPEALKLAEQYQRNKSTGQNDMFGGSQEDSSAAAPDITSLPPEPDWDEEDRLIAEKETLGLYLTGHPITRYEAEIVQMTGRRIQDQIESLGAPEPSNDKFRAKDVDTILAGLVLSIRTKNTKNGKMAFLVLDDRSARVDVVIRPDDYKRFDNIIVRDKVLVVEGGLGYDDFSGGYRIRAKQLFNLESARLHYAKRLELNISSSHGANGFIDTLGGMLSPYREGSCPIWVHYQGNSAKAPIRLGREWNIVPRDQLLGQLEQLVGPGNVRLVY